jgi:predicted MPP superfamily phosphohydrolase
MHPAGKEGARLNVPVVPDAPFAWDGLLRVMMQHVNQTWWQLPVRVRLGLGVAVVISAYALLSNFVMLPLHERQYLQPAMALLQGIDHLLQAPGLMVAQRLGLRAGHHTTLAAWGFAVALNGLLYFLVAPALFWLWSWTWRRPTPASGSAKGYTRRRFLVGSLRLVCLGTGAGLGYGLMIEPRRFIVTRHQVRIRGLPQSLDGLRIVQLTDVHHGPWLALDYVRAVIRAANELEPDLVCLTGDYVHVSSAYIEPVVAELAELRLRLGTLAVLGNHDWWEDAARMQRAFAPTGITLIDNERRVLTPDRRLVAWAEGGLALCGVGDLWEDLQDYRRALGGLAAEMPRLLLSHNPDVAEERDFVRSGLRVDLMLSGHTHGGQINLPVFGRPVTSSHYGDKYAHGLVQGPVCPVFVCASGNDTPKHRARDWARRAT